MNLLNFLLDFVKDQVHPQPAAPRRRLIVEQDDTFPEDTDRIMRVCAAAGFEIDRETAVLAWSVYCEEFCEEWYTASWMATCDFSDASLLYNIRLVTTVVEESP